MYSAASWLGGTASAQNYLYYCSDKKHPDHRDKIIGKAVTHGVPAGTTFLDLALIHISECTALNRRIRRGRKIKRKLQSTIQRVPDASWLKKRYKTWIQKETISRMGWKFAISWSHTDRRTGATDFHYVSPYRKGDKEGNPIARLRAVSDEIHTELNQMLLAHGKPRLETMPEVRSRARKKAGIKSLAEQLASVEDLTIDNLRANIERMGHTVTRFNPERETISVIHQGKKRAHRYSTEKLLVEAGALRSLRALSLPDIDVSGPSLSGP
jgi:hypothetical protein